MEEFLSKCETTETYFMANNLYLRQGVLVLFKVEEILVGVQTPYRFPPRPKVWIQAKSSRGSNA